MLVLQLPLSSGEQDIKLRILCGKSTQAALISAPSQRNGVTPDRKATTNGADIKLTLSSLAPEGRLFLDARRAKERTAGTIRWQSVPLYGLNHMRIHPRM
jgi:hypothetical protein